MEGGLVGAKVHVDVFIGQAFPKVDDIAYIGQRNRLAGCDGLLESGDEFVQAAVELVHPALLEALVGCLGVDFRGDANHTGDVARLGLGAGHTAEARRDEEDAAAVVAVEASLAELLAGGVHHRDGGAVDDALGADVHIRARSHLAVL